jgi:hypothetical protein
MTKEHKNEQKFLFEEIFVAKNFLNILNNFSSYEFL